MIIDNDNVFFDKTSLVGLAASAKTSKAVKTGKGEAYNPLWIYAGADQELEQDLTIAVQTAEDEDFATATTLGSYSLPKAKGAAIKAKVPVGNLGYLRLSVTGASTALTKGNLNAMLVTDVQIS